MKRIFNKETRDYDVVPSENYGPNKMLVSDADGNPRWEDKLSKDKAYQQYVTGADGKAKWEDRYGYTKWVETYTESVSFAAGDENSYFNGMTMDNTLGYAAAGTFSGDATRLNVVFDGVAYTNLEAGHYGDSNLPYFGNAEADGMTSGGDEGTGEPFVIFEMSEGWMVAPSDKSVAHEVVVTVLKQEIVPIPAEYLPGGGAQWLVIYKQPAEGIYQCNMSYDNIVTAIANRTLIGCQKVTTYLAPEEPTSAGYAYLSRALIQRRDNEEGYIPNICVTDDVNGDSYYILQDGTITNVDPNPDGAPV